MFDGIDTPQTFEDMVDNEDPRLVEVYEALPESKQVGFEAFLKLQLTLIRRYR
tara:strand:+ start:184 stop:342 length:159 start_codon:yes stop_codon:yes gene_type:complete